MRLIHQNNDQQLDKTVPDKINQSGAAHDKYEIVLNWYKLTGKNLLDEEALTTLPIDTLLNIIGNPIWNKIYHCWAIETKHMQNIQPYVQHKFQPEKFCYFVEAYHIS